MTPRGVIEICTSDRLRIAAPATVPDGKIAGLDRSACMDDTDPFFERLLEAYAADLLDGLRPDVYRSSMDKTTTDPSGADVFLLSLTERARLLTRSQL